jgi:triosephosphate isomerase
MRKKIVAANWKMNLDKAQANSLLEGISSLNEFNCEVVVCPAFPFLSFAQSKLSANIKLGAQNVHQAPEGAFTGEVNAQMLLDFGVQYCIVGHSERREYFGETDELVAEKIKALQAKNIQAIYCCGEKLEVRQNNLHLEYVEAQIRNSFQTMEATQIKNSVIAYEPVWAIGTGMTATPLQAEEMHAHIRKVWADMFGSDAAANLSILYGGSCKADNAEALFALPNVDGGLIGGASLKIDEFRSIVNACK